MVGSPSERTPPAQPRVVHMATAHRTGDNGPSAEESGDREVRMHSTPGLVFRVGLDWDWVRITTGQPRTGQEGRAGSQGLRVGAVRQWAGARLGPSGVGEVTYCWQCSSRGLVCVDRALWFGFVVSRPSVGWKAWFWTHSGILTLRWGEGVPAPGRPLPPTAGKGSAPRVPLRSQLTPGSWPRPAPSCSKS